MKNDARVSETVTENLFRDFYGSTTFIEKSAIPNGYGFVSKNESKDGKVHKGYPDFFLDYCDDFLIVVEAKGDDKNAAEDETQYYMENNSIEKPIVGIAIYTKKEKITASYFIQSKRHAEIIKFGPKNLLTLSEIKRQAIKQLFGDTKTNDELVSILNSLNEIFHKYGVKDTERSLFFSGLMIALSDSNFRAIYKQIAPPTKKSNKNETQSLNEAHNLNVSILDAITTQLEDKINNKSKEFNWADRFSFIKTIDIPLHVYKDILTKIEVNIFIPFQNEEKQDILGKAYKIFLKRAGKVDNKNIIITPDHIKDLMVKLARVFVNDVVIDTCTGTGGFLMSSMETMIAQSYDDPQIIKDIKEHRLIGFENDAVLFALACSNMFLHGDGRTNMIFHSSILNGYNDDDKTLLDYVKSLKPTKCIINPPYENNLPIVFVKQALNFLESNGKLIIIMPRITLESNLNETAEILETAKLDFVIHCPVSIFKEQDRIVYTSIFGFTKTPHNKEDKVLFYNLEDDGLVSVQHKGRIDKNKKWESIEYQIIDSVFNMQEIPNVSEKMCIFTKDGKLVPYGVQPNEGVLKNGIEIGDLFNFLKGSLQSEDNIPGKYTFITAAEQWKAHIDYDYEMEAIVYAVGAEGSLGRAHYVNGKFIASDLCLVMTEKNHREYPLDLEFYSYYLMSIRDTIVSELRSGTSKLTINPEKLKKYKIEYYPMDKQIELKAKIKKRLVAFNELREKYKKSKETLYMLM